MKTLIFIAPFLKFNKEDIIRTTDTTALKLIQEKVCKEIEDNPAVNIVSIGMLELEDFKLRLKQKTNKPIIYLPQQEMDLSFVIRLAGSLKEVETGVFFEPSTCKVVEITEVVR